MQHGGRRLDDVPAALCAAEAVVSGQTEVLVAAAAVWQLKHLAGNHCLLLGHAGGVNEKDQFNSHEQRRHENKEVWGMNCMEAFDSQGHTVFVQKNKSLLIPGDCTLYRKSLPAKFAAVCTSDLNKH